MRTSSRVSFSTYQIWTCERTSSVEPYRFFRRRAPAATPRTRPEDRPRKLTRRSASPSGNVFRMMASVFRAGMSCRRADLASNEFQHTARTARTRRTIVNTIRAAATQSLGGEFCEIPMIAKLEYSGLWKATHAFPGARTCEKLRQSGHFRAKFILLTCGFCRQVLSDALRESNSLLFSFPFLLRFATLLWTTAHVHSSQGQQSFPKLSDRKYHAPSRECGCLSLPARASPL